MYTFVHNVYKRIQTYTNVHERTRTTTNDHERARLHLQTKMQTKAQTE